MPERSNGAVLKTADRREAVRGFKSHPRRLAELTDSSDRRRCRCRSGSDRGTLVVSARRTSDLPSDRVRASPLAHKRSVADHVMYCEER